MGTRLGGANLECFMLNSKIIYQDTLRVFDEFARIFLTAAYQLDFRLEDHDHIIFDSTKTNSIILSLSSLNWKSISCVVIGQLCDVNCEVVLRYYKNSNIFAISTLEDFLWNYNDSEPVFELERLISFFSVCRRLSDYISATHALIGSEPCTPNEFLSFLAEPSQSLRIDPITSLSEESANQLFRWYLEVYTKRW